MATTIATVETVPFLSSDNLIKFSYLITVDAGQISVGNDTGELIMESVFKGRLMGVVVSCASEDYDFSLRTQAGVTAPSIHEIYQVSSANQTFADFSVGALFTNTDTTKVKNLYFILVNNDASNPTGDIDVQLYISKMGNDTTFEDHFTPYIDF